MLKYFHERNDYLLQHPINKNFEDVLWMNDDDFRNWISELRRTIVYAWDVMGLPPKVGFSETEIKKQFRRLSGYPVNEFEKENSIIRNTQTNLGMCVNSWFPTMMKTRINYKENDDGYSIYDHFAKDELFEKCVVYGRRHFKRDSFYHYSAPLKKNEKIKISKTLEIDVESAENFIEKFEFLRTKRNLDCDYWFKPVKSEKEYTGYNKDLVSINWIEIDGKKLETYLNRYDNNNFKKTLTNVNSSLIGNKDQKFQIMFFNKGQKIFPLGFKAFRISWCQYPVNFPPLTAKYLYERYTEHLKGQKEIVIYDPSMGWGGRILGAMSIKEDRNIVYLGTDPNEDHWSNFENKYEDLAKYYNKIRNSGNLFPHNNKYFTWCLGSEVIHNNAEFKKWKGMVDLIFTSPPYFNREAYSDSETQSYKKFDNYLDWKDGFLKQTIQTCYDWLQHERYFLWNISDLKIGKKYLPLVEDSKKIAEDVGFFYVETLKLTLANMPGANRVDHKNEETMAKYMIQFGGKYLKYEPIMVFWKK